MNYTLQDAIHHWLEGGQLNPLNDSLLGIKIVWVIRSASMLQFIGGLTILAEVLGQQRIENFQRYIYNLSNIRKLFSKTRKEIQAVWYIIHSMINKSDTNLFFEQLRKRDNISGFRLHIKYRNEIAKWKAENSSDYKRWHKREKAMTIWLNTYGLFIFAALLAGLFSNLLWWLPLVLFSFLVISHLLGITPSETSIDVLALISTILPIVFVLWVAYYETKYKKKRFQWLVWTIMVLPIVFMLSTVFVSFFLAIIKLIIFTIIGFILLKPALIYFFLARKEKLFKLLSFVLITIGFFLSMLCA